MYSSSDVSMLPTCWLSMEQPACLGKKTEEVLLALSLSVTSGSTASTNAFVAAIVLFIFQFPTIIGFLMITNTFLIIYHQLQRYLEELYLPYILMKLHHQLRCEKLYQHIQVALLQQRYLHHQ